MKEIETKYIPATACCDFTLCQAFKYCPLHAAAPEMLEALKQISEFIKYGTAIEPGIVGRVIAKAEGRV